ncbi:hypothetical protein FRC02_000253 [Tulasnella sp. 418]|nr:hypothetical protein FRC02_000253 [Tulasnella sp. 418]
MQQSLRIRRLRISHNPLNNESKLIFNRSYLTVGAVEASVTEPGEITSKSSESSQDGPRASYLSRTSKASTINPNFFTSRPSPNAWMISPQYLSLQAALTASSYSPSVVWDRYSALVAYMGSEPLPLELHQSTLRKCVTSPAQLRAYRKDWIRKLTRNEEVAKWRAHSSKWNPSLPPYNPLYFDDTRLRSVIRNIYQSGNIPNTEDYNFMLEFYAAAGNFRAPLSILREIRSELGDQALTAQTYELCLQAFAEYSEHKVHAAEMSAREQSLKTWANEVLWVLQSCKVALTSSMLESLLRMMQNFDDTSMLELLLSSGYGIDLRNPDRPWDPFTSRFARAYQEAVTSAVAPPQVPHMSTSALNAVITVLGRRGDIPGMVSAFEVLTSPLPRPPRLDASINSSGFDEVEDEEPVFYDSPTRDNSQTLISPPSPPRPNTKTYERMLKYAALSQNHLLCRYLLSSAMAMDRRHHLQLQDDIRSGATPLRGVAVAVTHNMLNSVLSTTNNLKSRMEWMEKVLRTVVSQKHLDALYFRKFLVDDHKNYPARNRINTPRFISQLDTFQVEASPTLPSADVERPFDVVRHLSYLNKEHVRAVEMLHHVRSTLRDWKRYGTPSPGPRAYNRPLKHH